MFRWFTLLAVLTVAASADTLKTFDGPIFSSVPLELTDQLIGDGLTFGSTTSGCTTAYCGFIVDNNTAGGLMVPSGPNYVRIAGNSGVNVTLDFSVPVYDVSFNLPGLAANGGGFLDGATVTFFDQNHASLGQSVILPVGPTSSPISTSLFSFASNTQIREIQFSKTEGASGAAMFAFDNLAFGVPEPGSVLLTGAGFIGLLFLRRRRTTA